MGGKKDKPTEAAGQRSAGNGSAASNSEVSSSVSREELSKFSIKELMQKIQDLRLPATAAREKGDLVELLFRALQRQQVSGQQVDGRSAARISQDNVVLKEAEDVKKRRRPRGSAGSTSSRQAEPAPQRPATTRQPSPPASTILIERQPARHRVKEDTHRRGSTREEAYRETLRRKSRSRSLLRSRSRPPTGHRSSRDSGHRRSDHRESRRDASHRESRHHRRSPSPHRRRSREHREREEQREREEHRDRDRKRRRSRQCSSGDTEAAHGSGVRARISERPATGPTPQRDSRAPELAPPNPWSQSTGVWQQQPGGIWQDPPVEKPVPPVVKPAPKSRQQPRGEPAFEKPVVQSAADGAASRAASRRAREAQEAKEVEQWLQGLDGGRGAMLRYLEPLQREFGSLAQVAAARLPAPAGSSVLENVDAMIFEALGIQSLGHRLLLAKGIMALSPLPS